MNIKFDNRLLLEYFKSKSMLCVEFGSNLYSVKNHSSDTDMMLVYLDSDFERISCFGNHHQFQYKDLDNNVDYIVTSVSNFIRNLCTGDSTINLEIVHSGFLKETPLSFLDDIKNELLTYKTIRSYLGLARRDLTDYWKQGSERDKNKAIFHGIRGYNFAKNIFVNKELCLKFDTSILTYEYLLNMDNNERKELSVQYQNSVKDLRDYVNTAYDNGRLGLATYLKPSTQQHIDLEVCKLHTLSERVEFPEEFKDLIYNVNEYGIKY